jgi:hypothetical protein
MKKIHISRSVRSIAVAVISISIIATVTCRPVVIFIDRLLFGYFKPVINRITGFQNPNNFFIIYYSGVFNTISISATCNLKSNKVSLLYNNNNWLLLPNY